MAHRDDFSDEDLWRCANIAVGRHLDTHSDLHTRSRDELVSSACLGVMQAVNRLKPEMARPQAWRYLLTRAMGQILDDYWSQPGHDKKAATRVHALARVVAIEDLSFDPGRPEWAYAAIEDYGILRPLFRELTPVQKHVLTELVVHGCSTAEVAQAMGVTPQRVSQIKIEALGRLRRKLVAARFAA